MFQIDLSGKTVLITGAAAGIGLGIAKMFATAGAVTGMVAGLIVGISRVILGFHSSSEVIAGCALGAAVAVASAYFVETRPRSFVQSIVFVGAMVALMGLLHGGKAPSEAMITKIALYLSGRTVPFYSHGRWS